MSFLSGGFNPFNEDKWCYSSRRTVTCKIVAKLGKVVSMTPIPFTGTVEIKVRDLIVTDDNKPDMSKGLYLDLSIGGGTCIPIPISGVESSDVKSYSATDVGKTFLTITSTPKVFNTKCELKTDEMTINPLGVECYFYVTKY